MRFLEDDTPELYRAFGRNKIFGNVLFRMGRGCSTSREIRVWMDGFVINIEIRVRLAEY